jgi:hypothetical protein
MENKSEIILYQTEDGQTGIQVLLENESVWLTIDQLAELFQKSRSTVNEHILNVYEEKELKMDNTMRKIGNSDFPQKPTNFYNLDVIISVGYRVKSLRGTQFRMWATKRLREYIIKGFTLNDERLKETGYGNPYFEELLERIRDIRTSEKNFYYKVREIYATSVDYDPSTNPTIKFFATIQNKFHWAIHHHTAAELIAERVNAQKPNMGLTSFSGTKPRKVDIMIAKNYLNESELQQLNLLVDQYLSFAESQALQKKVMYMKDWIQKLHEILTINDRPILIDAGKVSHVEMESRALEEYEKYRKLQDRESIENLRSLEEGLKEVTPKTGKRPPKKK